MKKLFFAMIAMGALAAVIFQVGLDPRIAGLIAGSGFVAIGIYGILISWPERRNRPLALASFGLALVHLFGVALPMLGFRLQNWDEPFSKVEVWGLKGPEFHQISTRLYGVWLVLVLLAWLVEGKRKKDPNGSFVKK